MDAGAGPQGEGGNADDASDGVHATAPNWKALVEARAPMRTGGATVAVDAVAAKRNVTVEARYDVAYLDGDFEAGVAEDNIQHRHT